MPIQFPDRDTARAERRRLAAEIAAQYTGSQAGSRRTAEPTPRQAAAQQREEIRSIVRRWSAARGWDVAVPEELKGATPAARAARTAWLEMHDAGRIAARLPYGTPEHIHALERTRAAQDRVLAALKLEREEVVARYGNSPEGRAAITLLQY